MIRFFTLLCVLMVFAPSLAHACTPCQTTWPMDRIISETEVVFLGQRVDKSRKNTYKEDDEFIEIRVDELLKPNAEVEVGDVLEVHSWYGACPYGVQMDRYEKAVVFLNKESDGNWFVSPTYESGTFKNALCNDEAMTLQGQNMLIWDPVVRQNVKYPLAEFRRVFLNRYPMKTLPN